QPASYAIILSCTHTHTRLQTHACKTSHTLFYLIVTLTPTHTQTHTHTHTCVYTHTHTHTHTQTHTDKNTKILTHTYTETSSHTNTEMHMSLESGLGTAARIIKGEVRRTLKIQYWLNHTQSSP